MMNLFASYTKTNQIMRLADGSVPFKSTSLDALFQARVRGQAVVMGRVTFELLRDPNGIPNCLNIVVSRNPALEGADPSVIVVPDLDQAAAVNRGPRSLWLIGGASLFDQALARGLIDTMVANEVWMPVTRTQADGALSMPGLRLQDFKSITDRFVHDDLGLTIRNQVYQSVL